MTTMGQRIKSLRIARGLTQAELARRIGIKGPSLWDIENDETKTLRGNTLAKLCVELRTTVGYILGDAVAHEGLELAAMEAELVYVIRSLPAEKRLALMEYARFLIGSAGTRPPPAQAQPGAVREFRPQPPKKR